MGESGSITYWCDTFGYPANTPRAPDRDQLCGFIIERIIPRIPFWLVLRDFEKNKHSDLNTLKIAELWDNDPGELAWLDGTEADTRYSEMDRYDLYCLAVAHVRACIVSNLEDEEEDSDRQPHPRLSD